MTSDEKIWSRFTSWWTVPRAAIAMLALGILIGVGGGLFLESSIPDFMKQMYPNASVELISIAITVLVINSIYQRREREDLKARLIREMGSPHNEVALRALKELQAHRWGFGEDTSLQRASLFDANLAGADLVRANLEGAGLGGANLEGAYLIEANLEGARLGGANLAGADLIKANLAGVVLVRANLEGAKLVAASLEDANLVGANLAGAYLRGANVERARLYEANLEGARHDTDEQLKQAYSLRGASMPDGSKYDGRFNLEGDIEIAGEVDVDVDDPDEMARWYAGEWEPKRDDDEEDDD